MGTHLAMVSGPSEVFHLHTVVQRGMTWERGRPQPSQSCPPSHAASRFHSSRESKPRWPRTTTGSGGTRRGSQTIRPMDKPRPYQGRPPGCLSRKEAAYPVNSTCRTRSPRCSTRCRPISLETCLIRTTDPFVSGSSRLKSPSQRPVTS